MKEKEREEDNDKDNDVVNITTVQLFGMPDEAFLGKETQNKNNKDEEEKNRNVDSDDGGNNSVDGTKRVENMRGGIDRYSSKG